MAKTRLRCPRPGAEAPKGCKSRWSNGASWCWSRRPAASGDSEPMDSEMALRTDSERPRRRSGVMAMR